MATELLGQATFPIQRTRSLIDVLHLVPDEYVAADQSLNGPAPGVALYGAAALAHAIAHFFPELAHKDDLAVLVVGSEAEAQWTTAAAALLGRTHPIRVLSSMREDYKEWLWSHGDEPLPAVTPYRGAPDLAPVDLIFALELRLPDPRDDSSNELAESDAWIRRATQNGIKVAGVMPTMMEADLLANVIAARGWGEVDQLIVPTYFGTSEYAVEAGRHLFALTGATSVMDVNRLTVLGELCELAAESRERFADVPVLDAGRIVQLDDYQGDVIVGVDDLGYCEERQEIVALEYDPDYGTLSVAASMPAFRQIEPGTALSATPTERALIVRAAALSLETGPDGAWTSAHAESDDEDDDGGVADIMQRHPPNPLAVRACIRYPALAPLEAHGLPKLYGDIVVEPKRGEAPAVTVEWHFADGTYVGGMDIQLVQPEHVTNNIDRAPWAACLLFDAAEFDKRVLAAWGAKDTVPLIGRVTSAAVDADLETGGLADAVVVGSMRAVADLLEAYGEARPVFTAQHYNPNEEDRWADYMRQVSEHDLAALGFLPANPVNRNIIDAICSSKLAHTLADHHPSVFVVPPALVARTTQLVDPLGFAEDELQAVGQTEFVLNLSGYGEISGNIAFARDVPSAYRPMHMAEVVWHRDYEPIARVNIGLLFTGGDLFNAARGNVMEPALSTLIELDGQRAHLSRRARVAWHRFAPDVIGVLYAVSSLPGMEPNLLRLLFEESMGLVQKELAMQSLGKSDVNFVAGPLLQGAAEAPLEDASLDFAAMGYVEAGPVVAGVFDVNRENKPMETESPSYLVPSSNLEPKSPALTH